MEGKIPGRGKSTLFASSFEAIIWLKGGVLSFSQTHFPFLQEQDPLPF